MELKHVKQKNLHHLFGGWQLGQGNEMSHLGKTINDQENYRVPFRDREAGNKVQRGETRVAGEWAEDGAFQQEGDKRVCSGTRQDKQ